MFRKLPPEVFDGTRLHLLAGANLFHNRPLFGLCAIVVPAKQLKQQFRLTIEIRVERAARVAGCLGDVLNARCGQSLFDEHHPRSLKQILKRLLFALYACQAFPLHGIT
ncbi:hypothetical protein SAMN06266956_4312 [Paraburkholderia hospita]|nr:hypothetical protein SAMN06266956_4312 [Paraburkholderia hospita]